jgi:hypothetical protein
MQKGRTRRHDTRSAGCGGREQRCARERLQGGLGLCLGCERLIRAGRAALRRTAKPCGPGTRCWCQALRRRKAPDRVRLSLPIREVTEARRIRLRGERGISRQTIVQGRPGCPGFTCGHSPLCICAPFGAQGAMGASRHPVFPAPLPECANGRW